MDFSPDEDHQAIIEAHVLLAPGNIGDAPPEMRGDAVLGEKLRRQDEKTPTLEASR